jgi:hypothetical protein
MTAEVAAFRAQQRVVVELLKNGRLLKAARVRDMRRWVRILAAAGRDDAAMHR